MADLHVSYFPQSGRDWKWGRDLGVKLSSQFEPNLNIRISWGAYASLTVSLNCCGLGQG